MLDKTNTGLFSYSTSYYPEVNIQLSGGQPTVIKLGGGDTYLKFSIQCT